MEAVELEVGLLPVGTTPVHIAVNSGRVGALRSLLDRTPSLVDQPDQFGTPPLAKALRNGRLEAAKVLIQYGANLNTPYGADTHQTLGQVLLTDPTFPALLLSLVKSDTSFHLDLSSLLPTLAYEGSADMIETILNRSSVDVDIRDRLKCTALHYGASRGLLNIVRHLLVHGANRILKTLVGATALHLACSAGHLEVVGAILEIGCDGSETPKGLLGIKNSAGCTPIECALSNRHIKVVQYLLTAHLEHLDLGQMLTNGHTISGYCFYLKYYTSRSTLVGPLANVSSLPCMSVEESQWLLHESIHTRNTRGLREAIAHGADVGCVDNMLQTPLMLAAKLGSVEVCRCLIDGGADPNVVDMSGKTAPMYGFEHGKHEVVAYLLSRPSVAYLNPHSLSRPIPTLDMLTVLVSHFEGIDCAVSSDWLAWLALAVPTASADLFQALVKALAPADWIEQMVPNTTHPSRITTEARVSGRVAGKRSQLPAYVRVEACGETHKPRPKLVRSFSQPRKWHFARAPPSTGFIWKFRRMPRPRNLSSSLKQMGTPFTSHRGKLKQQKGGDSVVHSAALHNLDVLKFILTSCKDASQQDKVLLSRDQTGRTALELILPQFNTISDACLSLGLGEVGGLDQYLTQEFPLPESLLFEETLLHYLCVGMSWTSVFRQTSIIVGASVSYIPTQLDE